MCYARTGKTDTSSHARSNGERGRRKERTSVREPDRLDDMHCAARAECAPSLIQHTDSNDLVDWDMLPRCGLAPGARFEEGGGGKMVRCLSYEHCTLAVIVNPSQEVLQTHTNTVSESRQIARKWRWRGWKVEGEGQGAIKKSRSPFSAWPELPFAFGLLHPHL